MDRDELFMKQALREAEKSLAMDEVPVGAVLVKDDRIIARAHNRRESAADGTGHAEISVMRKACKKLGTWRLSGCTLYVTLEPCAMCAGAAVQTRVDRIVFGAYDPKGGCCGSLYTLPADKRFNHRCEITGGVWAEPCGQILTDYFRSKRRKSRND